MARTAHEQGWVAGEEEGVYIRELTFRELTLHLRDDQASIVGRGAGREVEWKGDGEGGGEANDPGAVKLWASVVLLLLFQR